MIAAPTTTDTEQVITLDDLMRWESEGRRVEIIDGRVVDKDFPEEGEASVGSFSNGIVAMNVIRALDQYNAVHDLGTTLPDGVTYLMFDPAYRLKHSTLPDASFVLKGNFPPHNTIDNAHPGVPDLAVEVVSASDKGFDIQSKIRAYLDKGTRQVWVIYPATREIYQYINGEPETVRILKAGMTLDGGDLLPGFALPVADVFKLPAWAEKRDEPAS